jgi:Zn-finger nucleic acid-binding protein
VTSHLDGALRLVLASENVTRSAAAPGAETGSRTRRCPLDAEPLRREDAEGVEVDVCPVHGAWFDAGEVRRIANAHSHVGANPAGSGATPAHDPTKKSDPLDWLVAFVDALDATFEELE